MTVSRYHASLEVVSFDPAPSGTAIPFILKLRDEMGLLLSHTSPLITIVDPDGNDTVAAVAMASDPALNQSTYLFQTQDGYREGTYLAKASCTRTVDNVAITFRAKAKVRLSQTLD